PDPKAQPMRGTAQQAALRAKGAKAYRSRIARAEKKAGGKATSATLRKITGRAQGTASGKKAGSAQPGAQASPKVAAAQNLRTQPVPAPGAPAGKTSGRKADAPARQ
ncbi:MAG: hypothetical protein L0Y57_13500, partial [Beijerinckiaceae bacterium]|nr:hypothetical protein [Beijerinckiaceae bacterium]